MRGRGRRGRCHEASSRLGAAGALGMSAPDGSARLGSGRVRVSSKYTAGRRTDSLGDVSDERAGHAPDDAEHVHEGPHGGPGHRHPHPPDDPSGHPRIGFVGAGRVGCALAVAFATAGWPVAAVATRDPARRERFGSPGAGRPGRRLAGRHHRRGGPRLRDRAGRCPCRRGRAAAPLRRPGGRAHLGRARRRRPRARPGGRDGHRFVPPPGGLRGPGGRARGPARRDGGAGGQRGAPDPAGRAGHATSGPSR